jgi:hypothetical protein
VDESEEKGTTRRHTFFCINKERHTTNENVIEAVPKEIAIFEQKVMGWLITTEEPVIDKVIPLRESMQGEVKQHDPE